MQQETLREPGPDTGSTVCYPVATILGPSQGGSGSLDTTTTRDLWEDPHGTSEDPLLLGAPLTQAPLAFSTPPPPPTHKRPRRALGTFQQKNPAPVLECQADAVGQRCERPCSSRWDLCSDQLRLGELRLAWPQGLGKASCPGAGGGSWPRPGVTPRGQAPCSGLEMSGPFHLNSRVPSQEGSRVGAQQDTPDLL